MAEMTTVQKPVQTGDRMTADEYLKLPETTQRMELIDGIVFIQPASRPYYQADHQTAVFLTAKLIDSFALGGRMLIAPIDVEWDNGNVKQPDVLWVSPTNTRVQISDQVYGAPDFIAEILSPGMALQDKREKYRLYERYGVREYWLIDPLARFVEVFTYNVEDATFAAVGAFGVGETFTSPLFGRDVEVKVLFPEG